MTMDSEEATIRHEIKRRFESTFEERVARAKEVRHHPVMAHHHFTWASAECVYVYRDGHFVATILMTQAVNEGIIRFAADRNGIKEKKKRPELVDALLAGGFISEACAEAMRRILKSFRNDFFHMNPSVSNAPVIDIAKRNVADLATIESELFACTFEKGGLRPKHRQYWDVSDKGTILVNIRPG